MYTICQYLLPEPSGPKATIGLPLCLARAEWRLRNSCAEDLRVPLTWCNKQWTHSGPRAGYISALEYGLRQVGRSCGRLGKSELWRPTLVGRAWGPIAPSCRSSGSVTCANCGKQMGCNIEKRPCYDKAFRPLPGDGASTPTACAVGSEDKGRRNGKSPAYNIT